MPKPLKYRFLRTPSYYNCMLMNRSPKLIQVFRYVPGQTIVNAYDIAIGGGDNYREHHTATGIRDIAI
jgi:hypothetical protein